MVNSLTNFTIVQEHFKLLIYFMIDLFYQLIKLKILQGPFLVYFYF